ARDAHRIEQAVERLGIEQEAGGVESAGPARQARNEEPGVAGAVDVAGGAAHAGAPREAAQDARRVEREVAEIDQRRLAAAHGFRVKQLARAGERILAELAAGRQRGRGPGRKGGRGVRRGGGQRGERRGGELGCGAHWAVPSRVGGARPIFGAALCSSATSPSVSARSLSMSRLRRSALFTAVFSRAIAARTRAASCGSPASIASAK